MRLQWPRFLSKPEPDRAQEPCTARIDSTGHMTSVLTGVSSTLDTAYTNKVSSLAATVIQDGGHGLADYEMWE
ncbi:hypothetical protein TIFTF001_051042 [Ficus carica]|uniref:Uncharacterized protein n=1 Tax=Ficus carica TaxID=3494 RepID=A0AA88CHS9_FICCA|nr:hypothetical protein TIFTF001_051042 [Ficus carica]